MDDHTNAPSSWPPNSNCFWEVGLQHQHDYAEMEAVDLKQALLRTTLELESTRVVAQEELKKLEAQSLHLAHLLQITTNERDEARHHCHSLLLLLSNSKSKSNPNPSPNPSPSPNLEESINTASSSEEEEEESSKLTSPAAEDAVDAAVRERGLPEKGRLVEAVMRAGPLLQTLLLAGPLPQWRHPPPSLQSFEIPPVSINVNPTPTNDEKKNKRKREDGKQQSPPTSLNLNSSSPESNANTKFHHNHHQQQQQQQYGSLRA